MLTPNETRDAKLYANMDNPTTWHKRQLVKLYIKSQVNVTVRVFPGINEEEQFYFAYLKARQYFKEL